MKQAQQMQGYAALVPQNYVELNRGDMYVPHGYVTAPIYEAVLATPWCGPMPVHAVPVYYARPQASARVRSGVGVVTPATGVQ